MKNKFVLVLLALLILIPSVIAILNYQKMQSAPANTKTAVSITLSDTNGTRLNLEKKESGDEADKAITLFDKLISNATKIVALPDQLSGAQHYLVTMSTTVKETVYKFYFSENPNMNYFVSEEGGAYQLTAADAEEFLRTRYAASVYGNTALPTMLLSSQHNVRPSSATWNYTTIDDTEQSAVPDGYTSSNTETFTIENGFTLEFSLEPDFLTLKITDTATGEVYFDDKYSELASLGIKDTKSVTVDVSAKWYKTETRSTWGEFAYKFNTNITAPASFVLTTVGTLEPGEFVGITALNVADVSKIGFSSTPALTYEPQFIMDGKNAYAFLPLSVDDEAGDYKLILSYGGVAQELDMTIAYKEFGTSWANYPAAIYNTYYTETAKNSAATELAPYLAYSAAKQYWNGGFAQGLPDPDKTTPLVSGFGRTMVVMKDGVDTGNKYRHEGVDYYAADGTDITAVNAGEVIYSGIVDYWGYIVIVEHGYGLKSWYCNLGSTSVKTGDTVEKGTKIGTAGKTGLAYQSGAHIGLSVFDTFVCPYDIQDSGFTFKTEN